MDYYKDSLFLHEKLRGKIGTKIKMTVSRDDKTYVCSSLGIHFHIGVLDVVVLFKHDDDE